MGREQGRMCIHSYRQLPIQLRMFESICGYNDSLVTDELTICCTSFIGLIIRQYDYQINFDITVLRTMTYKTIF